MRRRSSARSADWPGLEQEQLHDGQDPANTADIRHVLGELESRRLGNPDTSFAFPDQTFELEALGLFQVRWVAVPGRSGSARAREPREPCAVADVH